MAADGVALLDALGIERAHVLGASMGGMIAQELAIQHPRRVASLISVMSSTGEPRYGGSTPEAQALIRGARPATREAAIAFGERTAALVPGAQLLMLDDMGHDRPEPLWPVLWDAVAAHTAG